MHQGEKKEFFNFVWKIEKSNVKEGWLWPWVRIILRWNYPKYGE